MPLSEALAARHHANRPWWRRAAQSIEHRIPATLHGRWGLSLPAAAVVALVAVAGAAVGGWYLTRSQSTVVDVAASSAEAASTTQPPDDDHATPSSNNTGVPTTQARGRPGGATAEHEGACHPHPWPSTTPQALPTTPTALPITPAALPATPTAWIAHTMKVVPVAASPALITSLPASQPQHQRPIKAGTWTQPVIMAASAPHHTAIGRWHHAPITHRYANAMAPKPKHQSCPSHTAMSTAPALSGPASAGAVIVDVEGKVAHPGIQTLPAGARVYEALAAAGGALPGVDATALDLARPVTDGEQLRVGIAGAPTPVIGLPQPAVGAPRGKHGKPTQPVNLNTATLEQLETVPDVGPALAQRILDWRTEHGRFESVSQLRQVRGIGERKFADMSDSVTV